MSVYGIVSEFNPFHFGHKYLIDSAKELGADAVVCAMSGNSTQRGELALIDKYLRAEAACVGGADLVLELPFPFCSASAESFALGGVCVLSYFCDTLIFGSECGDISLLTAAAELAASREFREEYFKLLSEGERSAAAYVTLIKNKLGATLSSNDLLGVEYIKAARTLSKPLKFVTVKRSGSSYLEDSLLSDDSDGFDSAMAIRKAFFEGDLPKSKLPERSLELLILSREKKKYTDHEKYLDAARFYFRLCEPSVIAEFAECEGGVAERICRCAHESSSGAEFLGILSTKRYTDAKLRRAMLFALCGVRESDISVSSLPVYTNLLAANETGRDLLSLKRKEQDGNSPRVITKPADVTRITSKSAKRQTELMRRLDAIYSFSQVLSGISGEEMLKKPYIT